MRRIPLLFGSWLLLLAWILAPLAAAAEIETLNVDLAPLIGQAAQHRERFAVNVPHRISSVTQGMWTTNAGTSQWTYAVRIPTSVSMSFHAANVVLPPSARLTVTSSKVSSTYRAGDVHGSVLWSRPLLGDTLNFTLTVNASEAAGVRLEVDSLQAGYRALAGRAPDHPAYKALFPNATATSCIENYSCNSTAENQGPAQATVAVLIANLGQCTGTLLNNARDDGRPYVLTARHCENGELGGGEPGAAGSVSIYWNAVTPCGQVLGSIYDGAVQTQSGAHTVVEQQDAWLIELDQAPVIAEPYFAGWDATGGVFVGGYSVHHAMGFDKRFTGWHGQSILQHVPRATLQINYDSDFWGLVNAIGSVGAGASGGALFDPGNRVVGSASLAYLVNGSGSEGVCPVANPPAPSPATVTAQYTALSAIFNSTADTTSTTGGTTLQTVLDPDNTGQLTLDGMGLLPMSLVSSTTNEQTERLVTLSWNVSWAQSCTASGGRPGDGWTGALPAAGSVQVTEIAGGDVRYVLSCVGGDRRGQASTSVSWLFIAAYADLRGPTGDVMIGSLIELRWDSNVQPCTASDGVPGDGWAGTKSQQGDQTLTATRMGSTTYSITCGTGVRVATAHATVNAVAPSVTLYADATRLRTGAEFNIWWHSDAQGVASCNASGGVPSWPANNQNVQSSGSGISTSSVAGTFTYTMTCSGGGLSSSSSVTVVFVDEPQALSIAAISPQQEIYPPGPPFTSGTDNLLWTSNQGFCHISSLGPVTNTSVEMKGQYPAGTAAAVETIAGLYTYELWCGGVTARTTIQWVTANPQVSLSESTHNTNTWVSGYPYQLSWTSNTTPCTASGGSPGDGWAGDKGNSVNAAQTINAPALAGTYVYSLTCGTGSSTATKNFVVTVPPPSVTLTATPSNPSVQRFATLQWDATEYPCVANADGAGVPWGGGANMVYSGQWTVFQATPGTYTYTITCGTGTLAVSASTQVTFRASAPTVLQASATSASVGTPVTLSWQSDGNTCTANGGVAGDGWSGPKPVSGTATVTSLSAGSVGYAINCDSGGQSLSVTYTSPGGADPAGPKPSTTLTASRTSQAVGQNVTLTWDSQNADACVGSGGTNGDGWSGSLSLSGTMNVTSASAGSMTYSVTCTGAPPAATADVTVVFSAASSSGGGGGGGGGGGAIDSYQALFLLTLLAMRAHRRRKELAPD